MKFFFIFALSSLVFIFQTEEIFGQCFDKRFVIKKNKWTKNLLKGFETSEVKILFSDDSIARLYAVRFTTSNFKSSIYLQKNKNLLINASKLAKKLDASIIINAGFYDHNYRPMGYFRSNGKTYNSRILLKGTRRSLHFGALLHIDKKTNRIMIHDRDSFNENIPGDVLQAGPFLFRKGKPVKGLRKYREFNRADRRTVLCISKEGAIVILVSESSDRGISWCELQKLFAQSRVGLGFYVKDAINLDGGSSTQLSINFRKFKRDIYGRPVPAFVVFHKK